MSALTLYECPECVRVLREAVWHVDPAVGGYCPGFPVAFRVFREEDVRPLWEEARKKGGAFGAYFAFPAPEEWKR